MTGDWISKDTQTDGKLTLTFGEESGICHLFTNEKL